MSPSFSLARQFIHTQARLLERLLFAVRFEQADPAAVGHLISAYQKPDGGLGNALEPDVRCPESQPLFVEVGLSALHEVGWRDEKLCLSICKYLESVSGPDGLVPLILPSALASPHASHMSTAGPPDLNPTAGICGLLHYQDIQHPWLERATQSCCQLILTAPPPEAHTLVSASILAEYHPDPQMGEQLASQIASSLPHASFYLAHAPVQTYSLTPLHFARRPDSRWRGLFTDEQVGGHLDDLAQKQQADGGWPISWEAPGPAAACEWRGCWTWEAVSILVAYGKMQL
jgi:hypothetical protein